MPSELFESESDTGVLAIVSADAGETSCMTSDRAWLVARCASSGLFESLEQCHSAARAAVWEAHLGCGARSTEGLVRLAHSTVAPPVIRR